MYNQEMVKNLFKQAGIKVEVEEVKKNCFYVKVDNKKNIYFWDNEIVNKQRFEDNVINFYKELKKVLTNR